MLRLQSCVLTHLLSHPAEYPVSSIHRLFSAAAAAVSPIPSFAVEDYLVDTCGLTRAQALKASTKLSHLKSPTNPDAVLAFLAGLGLSSAAVAAVVAKDPRLLCAKVEKTLAPVVVGLTGHGLSHTEIARLVSLVPASFRRTSIVPNVLCYLSFLGSHEDLFRLLKRNSFFLSFNFDNRGKPNVALLRECGLGTRDIAKLCIQIPRLLTSKPESLQAMVACAEAIGVPRGSGMFMPALQAVRFLGEEKIAVKVEYLKKTFMWSDAEVGIAVCKAPSLLSRSKEAMQTKSNFLISDVGLAPAYIAQRPAMLTYSLEGRIRPRYYVLKFLKENGLLDRDRDYYAALMISDKVFMKKLICPFMEAAPHLAEDYAAACKGEVPTRFRFT